MKSYATSNGKLRAVVVIELTAKVPHSQTPVSNVG